MIIMMMRLLLKKLFVLLCMPQNAQECTRMHLRTPKITKISWGSMTPDFPRVNDCRAAMFSTSANDIAPPDGKVRYGPGSSLWSVYYIMQLYFHCKVELIPKTYLIISSKS